MGEDRLKRRMTPNALRPHARALSRLVGKSVSEERVLEDLDRFVNRYRTGIEEANRAVLVLHGVPPGLVGPSSKRYTWQTDLGRFCGEVEP